MIRSRFTLCLPFSAGSWSRRDCCRDRLRRIRTARALHPAIRPLLPSLSASALSVTRCSFALDFPSRACQTDAHHEHLRANALSGPGQQLLPENGAGRAVGQQNACCAAHQTQLGQRRRGQLLWLSMLFLHRRFTAQGLLRAVLPINQSANSIKIQLFPSTITNTRHVCMMPLVWFMQEVSTVGCGMSAHSAIQSRRRRPARCNSKPNSRALIAACWLLCQCYCALHSERKKAPVVTSFGMDDVSLHYHNEGAVATFSKFPLAGDIFLSRADADALAQVDHTRSHSFALICSLARARRSMACEWLVARMRKRTRRTAPKPIA